MAFRYDEQYVEAGVVTDPRDLMVNVNAYASEMAGHMDRDSIPSSATIAATKWAVQAIMSTGSNPVGGDGTIVQTLAAGQTATWTTITPMNTTVTTDDGALAVRMDINWSWTGATAQIFNDRLEVRLLIDGRVVSVSGWSSIARLSDSLSLSGYVPVTAGSVTVSVQMRAYAAPYTFIDDINNGVNVSANTAANSPATSNLIDVIGGNVVWEHAKR